MLVHMKTLTTGELAELSMSVPLSVLAAVIESISDSTDTAELRLTLEKRDLAKVMDAISYLLAGNGHEARQLNEEGEELYSDKEVFPEGYPAMALRGLRGKEGLTQKEFAERIGVTQHRVSELESGRRLISKEMAKRIGQEFGISYKVFL